MSMPKKRLEKVMMGTKIIEKAARRQHVRKAPSSPPTSVKVLFMSVMSVEVRSPWMTDESAPSRLTSWTGSHTVTH
jgi:hypothetical protein